jgi:hypothetical protein
MVMLGSALVIQSTCEEKQTMNSYDVVGYSFNADCYCVDCTIEAFGGEPDEDTEDSDGNPVHPIFAGDEHEETVCCGDCGAVIAEVTP